MWTVSVAGNNPEERGDKLASTRVGESGDPENFASTDRERHVVDDSVD